VNDLRKLLLLFFVVALLALVLGGYYLYLQDSFSLSGINLRTNVIFQKMGIQEKLLVVESTNPTLTVEVDNYAKLIAYTEKVGVWSEGVPLSHQNLLLVKPKRIILIITNEEQKDIPFGKEGFNETPFSLGYKFNKEKEELKVLMHYSPDYLQTFSEERFKVQFTKDVLFYLYGIAGGKFQKIQYPQLFSQINDFIRNQRSEQESWFTVKFK